MTATKNKRGNCRPALITEPFLMRAEKGVKEDMQKIAREDGFIYLSNLTRYLWNYYKKHREKLKKK